MRLGNSLISAISDAINTTIKDRSGDVSLSSSGKKLPISTDENAYAAYIEDDFL